MHKIYKSNISQKELEILKLRHVGSWEVNQNENENERDLESWSCLAYLYNTLTRIQYNIDFPDFQKHIKSKKSNSNFMKINLIDLINIEMSLILKYINIVF